MCNYGLNTADRRTHIKIVLMSLIAVVVVVGVGTAARTEMPNMEARMVRSSLKAVDKPVVWTQADRVTIR